MRTRTPPEQPAVQVLDVIQDGEIAEAGGRSQPSAGLVVAVLIALAGGLLYGYFLGRGDRPPDEPEAVATTTPGTVVTSTSVTIEPLGSRPAEFRLASPGHDLGRGVTEYLNADLFQSIAVDDRGLVWAGGPAGVVRLDPATGRFSRLTDAGGTGPLDVRDLAAGPEGAVYVATGRGLIEWDGSEWTNHSVMTQFEPDLTPEVGPVAVTTDGTVWLATREFSGWVGASYVHHSSDPFYLGVTSQRLDGWIEQLGPAPDGTLWALGDEILWHYDGQWTGRRLPGWRTAIAPDGTGGVWVGGEDTIVHFDREGTATTEIPWGDEFGLERPYGEPGGMIRLMTADTEGSVWALAEIWEPGPDWPADDGEDHTSLFRIEEGTISWVPLPEESSEAWVADMASAPNGDLWLAAEGGLLRFEGTGWREFSIEDQPPVGSGGSMTVTDDGHLWMTGDGTVTRLSPGAWDVFDLGTGDGDLWLASDGDTVWAGVGCRVFEFGDDRWVPLPHAPAEAEQCWRSETAAADGSLLLAAGDSWNGGNDVYRWAGDEWSTLGRVTFDVASIDVGPDGIVWLAGWQGLGRIGDDGLDLLVTGQPFEHIVVDAQGTVWASVRAWRTAELWRLKDGVWEVDQEDRFGSTTIALARHPDGSVWRLEEDVDGGFAVRSSTGTRRIVVDAGPLHTMTIGPDGTIWVSGEGALYRVLPPGAVNLTVMEWRIELDGAGPGFHTVHMNVKVDGIDNRAITATSGTLVWNGTVVDLCRIGIDSDDGFLGVGDIFQTTEGCGTNPKAMQDAFDEFGPPTLACVVIEVENREQPLSHCAPLEVESGETP